MDRTNSKSDAPLTRGCSGPVRYRLVGPNDEFGGLFASATAAAEVGRRTWPDTPQYADCDGMGAFWDVEVVEAG